MFGLLAVGGRWALAVGCWSVVCILHQSGCYGKLTLVLFSASAVTVNSSSVFFVGVHFHDANGIAEFRLDLLELRRDQHARAAPRGEEVDDQRGGAILWMYGRWRTDVGSVSGRDD